MPLVMEWLTVNKRVEVSFVGEKVEHGIARGGVQPFVFVDVAAFLQKNDDPHPAPLHLGLRLIERDKATFLDRGNGWCREPFL